MKLLSHLYLEGLQWGTLVLTDGDITRISCEWTSCHCEKEGEIRMCCFTLEQESTTVGLPTLPHNFKKNAIQAIECLTPLEWCS